MPSSYLDPILNELVNAKIQGVRRSIDALHAQNVHLGETQFGGQFSEDKLHPDIGLAVSDLEEQYNAFTQKAAKDAVFGPLREVRRLGYFFFKTPKVLVDLNLEPREGVMQEMVLPYTPGQDEEIEEE